MKYKLLFLAVLSLGLAGCGDKGHELNSTEKNTAEIGARQFAERSKFEFISCSGSDSDGDGYVTCSIKDLKSSLMTNLLCSYRNSSVGCKSKNN